MFDRFSLAVALFVAVSTTPSSAFEFTTENSCLLLNGDNTDILTSPEDCFNDPDFFDWCLCTRTIFTNPVWGETTSVEQGGVQATEQAGVGNFRAEFDHGTLDLSTVQTGDVLGTLIIKELIPEAAGFPPGAFFNIEMEFRATTVAEGVVDFDAIVVHTTFHTRLVLSYTPTDSDHSDGLVYRGRITAHGPGNGFTFEYRYEGEEGKLPGIEPTDQDSPGFNVRYVIALFDETHDVNDVYTLPASGNAVDVHRHLSEDARERQSGRRSGRNSSARGRRPLRRTHRARSLPGDRRGGFDLRDTPESAANR